MSEQAQAELPMAVPTRQVENDRVIVTEWRFSPGAHTGWHVHSYDYVVVPMTTGTLRLDTLDGPSTSDLVAGQSYAREKGVEHDVINVNDYEFVFIEIDRVTELELERGTVDLYTVMTDRCAGMVFHSTLAAMTAT